MASASGGSTGGLPAPAIAQSGSFRPWPVRTQTTVLAGREPPVARGAAAARPRTPRTPSRRTRPRAPPAGTRTGSPGRSPPRSPRRSPWRPSTARSQDAGLPMRIAVAIVGGVWRSALPGRSAPRRLAWNPNSAGGPSIVAVLRVLGVPDPVARDVAGVADRDEVQVGRSAERVADLERRGLLALEPVRVHGVHQGDRVAVGQDPRAPRGTRRSSRPPPGRGRRGPGSGPSSPGRSGPWGPGPRRSAPASPAYAAADALVLPVDAHTTAREPSSRALEIARVIPRSLNEPVGLAPSNFR